MKHLRSFCFATLMMLSLGACSESARYFANMGLTNTLTRPDPNEELVAPGQRGETVACCACTTAQSGRNVVWKSSSDQACEGQETGLRFSKCEVVQSLDRTCSLAQIEFGTWNTAPLCRHRAIAFKKADETVGELSPPATPGDCEFETASFAAPSGGLEGETGDYVPGAAPLSVCACRPEGGSCSLIRWLGGAQQVLARATPSGGNCDLEACRIHFSKQLQAFCPRYDPNVARLYSRG